MDINCVKNLLKKGDLDGLKKFLSEGGDVLAPLPGYQLPALAFMMFGFCGKLDSKRKEEIILFLIEEEIKIRRSRNMWNDVTYRLKLYLMFSLKYKLSEKIVHGLINMGPGINAIFDNRSTPLCFAIGNNYSTELISALIKCGANINVGDRIFSALNKLCKNCNEYSCESKEVITLLMKEGLDLKNCDNKGNTILHLVDCFYMIKLALKNGISIEMKNKNGFTPLMSAVIKGQVHKVEMLLKFGATPNYCLVFTLIVIPAINRDYKNKMYRFLTQNCGPHYEPCMSPDRKENLKNGSRCDIIDLLLYYGADLHDITDDGESLLDILCVSNDFTDDLKKVVQYYLHYIDENDLSIILEFKCETTKKKIISFSDECKKELNKMKSTFIKDGLTFYEFCILQKFCKSEFVDISAAEYKYNYKTIMQLFPIYSSMIIVRIKNNKIKKWNFILNYTLQRIAVKPHYLSETVLGVELNYDCLHYVTRYLNCQEIYNLFLASASIDV